jgi:hypothetical protein
MSTRIKTTGRGLLPGDVIADSPGGPAFTIKGVDWFGLLVIVDFEDGTSTPPIPNGTVEVIRDRAQ